MAMMRLCAGNATELTPEHHNEIKEGFELVDTNGSGSMDTKELKAAMRALGFEPMQEVISKWVGGVDDDGSGTIEYPAFLKMMICKILKSLNREPKDILKAFKRFDDDSTKKIYFRNLKRFAKELAEQITEEDGDVEVNGEELDRIMKKTNACDACDGAELTGILWAFGSKLHHWHPRLRGRHRGHARRIRRCRRPYSTESGRRASATPSAR
eukprot:NODE_11113_length_1307_cov_3.697458.p1 GENE.NODE_11113_length_1307_cov_3.697458~~NODE_11113_length_1307_cov_3.697458.p1  ORF type:complete len:242 (+),score=52.32 NODE_11113_length_1307_cov_3.697458:92-727(+)